MVEVFSVSPRLKRWSATLIVWIPVSVFAVLLFERAPYWRMPIEKVGIAVSMSLIASTALILLVRSASKLGLYLLYSAILIVSAGGMILALGSSHAGLGYLSLIFLVSFGVVALQIRRELKSELYSAGVNWFEGQARAVVHVEASLQSIGGGTETDKDLTEIPARLIRMSSAGCFITLSSEGSELGRKRWKNLKELKLRVSFLDHSLTLPVEICSVDSRLSGMGLRFIQLSNQQEQALSRLLRKIKERGYGAYASE